MLTIHNYSIPVQDYFSLNLPKGAKILTVQTEKGEPKIWALVNPAYPTETRNFRLAVTGHPIKESEEDLKYIGTFQLCEAGLIGHLFEIRENNHAI
ncbi:MAG: hypothetical protein QME57_04180 [Patescibacteria group bacterium]|nr:hypothetical protein [Patescibacteria group bacterium]